MLRQPTQLLDGVDETVRLLAERYPLILVTKGDLMTQEQKVARSGLADLFTGVEIVSEKDPATYQRILTRHHVMPECFVMVGNSVKSDVLPVLEIGGRAVHVPAELTWVHEQADHDGNVPTIRNLRELPALLEALAGASPP
jgi:putative hydrolase of the HAD superfamily